MSHPEQASVPTIVILPDQANLTSTTTTSSPSSTEEGNICIQLDATEVRIFDTMLAAAGAFASGTMQQRLPNKVPQNVEIRVAGGWVRDKKVLGINGYDIDTAIDWPRPPLRLCRQQLIEDFWRSLYS
jgi:hypothetical protein